MTTQANENIPVVDVDQAFPAMVDASRPQSAAGSGDVVGTIDAALRTALGWRPRAGDPKAFLDALQASFRLRQVEGHTVADYVPRGYAVQADLGAVTGGQASLYRRAEIARTEMLRILDGLVPLRTDADQQDMDAYRSMVRNAVQRLVDEIGAAGGPRVQMVDQYFRGLTGQQPPTGPIVADTVGGQLGGLRDRFGLIDANVNTIEEEGIRTSFWTLVDLVVDLQNAWNNQRVAFTGQAGQGFLGTDLILISRLMEAAADQVDELESVLDSVLIPVSERRTIMLDPQEGLTLDGLLTWLRAFLSEEGRRIAQDSGRDGIVSFVAPTAVQLLKTFRQTLADKVTQFGQPGPVQLLPASCCAPLPAGLIAARTRIAIASLCRLLTDLAKTAQRVGRFPRAVLLNVTVKNVATRDNTVEVEFRGINLRSVHIPAFVIGQVPDPSVDCPIDDYGTDGLLLALAGSSTADDESVSAFFEKDQVFGLMSRILPVGFNPDDGFTVPAEDVATALIDGESGLVVYAPTPGTYPDLQRLDNPLQPALQGPAWNTVNPNETLRAQPTASYGGARQNQPPGVPAPGTGTGGGGSGGGCGCGSWGGGGGCGGGCGCGCHGCHDDCDDDGGNEEESEIVARLTTLELGVQGQLEEMRALQRDIDAERRLKDVKAWNELLDERDELAEKEAAEKHDPGMKKKKGKKGKKDKGCRGDCDGKKHPCGGCGHVFICGCFPVCGECGRRQRATSPVQAKALAKLDVFREERQGAALKLAEANAELSRVEAVHATLVTSRGLATTKSAQNTADQWVSEAVEQVDGAKSALALRESEVHMWDTRIAEQQAVVEAAVTTAASDADADSEGSAEKLDAEKLDAEKLAGEKLAAEKLAAEKLAAEKLAAEKSDAEKSDAEKSDAEVGKVTTNKPEDDLGTSNTSGSTIDQNGK